jgi:dTDP-4-dehydrorhamnose reductase
MDNIVILGDGLLGTELVKQTGWNYISRKKDNFDIRKEKTYYDFFLENYDSVAWWPKYKTIVNCIANTNTYSNNKELHWDINFKSVVQLTNFCTNMNIKLVQISTDYVYTNSVTNASEDDIPIHGNNWYSYTKLLGDGYAQLNANNLVLRGTHKQTPFPYDSAWVDQIGNFDYVDIIAKLYIELINRNACGLFNVGTDLKTMLDLAKRTNVNSSYSFIPNTQIPSDVSMDVSKLKTFLTL